MTPSARRREKKHWYKINVDTLRGVAVLVGLALVVGGGYWGYRLLQGQFLEREVEIVVAEAQGLIDSLRGEQGIDAYGEEFATAGDSLERARVAVRDGRLVEALRDAEHSRSLLGSILNALRHRGPAGEAQFIAVRGGVEFRRGERGEWRPARSRLALYAGDYVKTAAGGNAEVMFQDGTVVTVKSDTVILIDRSRSLLGGRKDRKVGLEYGWVNLSTAQGVGTVTTPSAEAVVDRDSQALVAYDETRKVGRFASYQGAMKVTTGDGGTRAIGELQQVVQTGGGLSRPQPLPAVPLLDHPADGAELAIEEGRLVLRWQQVSGAERYALQVSSSPAFVDNIIDVEDRRTLQATLGLRAEGAYVWRVAAFGREGVKGPWSPARAFRVVPGEGDSRSG